MVLLVAKESRISAPEELWKCDKIEEALICLPAPEPAARHFQDYLARLKVDWFPSIETSSLALIETYVANGLGVGISVQLPGGQFNPKVRALALPDCPPVIVGLSWRGKPAPLTQLFIQEAQQRARRLA